MRKVYRINEFAKRIGRAPCTVRRWEREGILAAKRLPSGHRYFDESDVRAILGGGPEKRSTAVYCRVSSAGQRDDLQSQVAAMEEYCRAGAIAVDEWIQEVGGGMNFKRKRFLALIERIQRGEIERVLIAHKARSLRIRPARPSCARERVRDQESLSPEQEMAEDLLAIVHTFSCRLYGMRKYKKQIKEDYPGSKEPKEILE
ncbi:recombinase [Cupriavidus sp. SK-4]|uniref:IS607 family transposase n=1 Tax=Cupriavidus sp. SK-4 TaxID=574750 RepID=UPI00044A572D|nr:IS607 family transposase [Cupriavidus sp. SK-4]EYS97421.1 recombinase [Cupriavidus sp. SK-4]